MSPLAEDIAAVSGLRWKVWLMNEAESEAGGLQLFEDGASAGEFLEGPIAAQIAGQSALIDMSVKQFDVMEDQSIITRGPI